jgi:hypothetical protein
MDAFHGKVCAALWNCNRKYAALAEHALYMHASTVNSDQLVDERESDPCPLVRSGVSPLDPMKAFEHTR